MGFGATGNVAYGAKIGSNHTGRTADQEAVLGEGIFFGLGVRKRSWPFCTFTYENPLSGASSPVDSSFPLSHWPSCPSIFRILLTASLLPIPQLTNKSTS